MNLEEVEYFAKKKRLHPGVFRLAERAFNASLENPDDMAEMQRRLKELSRSRKAEHLRQSGNFMAEVVAFMDLYDKGLAPHWVPESATRGVKMPDIKYGYAGKTVPVEVKHLNNPRDEHEDIYAGHPRGGSIDFGYAETLDKKVQHLVNDAKTKFTHYHAEANDTSVKPNRLYIFYTKSLNADVADMVARTLAGFDGSQSKDMGDHIRAVAQPMLDTDTELIIRSLNT